VTNEAQAYSGRAPAFASDEFQLPYLDLEEYHLTEQAIRRLIRQVRKQLQRADAYDGSKVQLLDGFEVKLSQLSATKIVLRPGIHEPTKAQRALWDNRNTAKEPKVRPCFALGPS
jgi:hypothetical protein